jgi:septal ring factor EnvC (AmiA/AmiB activator)
VLGTTGEVATLFGDGLYFEIRRGTVAEDPLLWFRPGAVARR